MRDPFLDFPPPSDPVSNQPSPDPLPSEVLPCRFRTIALFLTRATGTTAKKKKITKNTGGGIFAVRLWLYRVVRRAAVDAVSQRQGQAALYKA
jgi:hypothetical protein